MPPSIDKLRKMKIQIEGSLYELDDEYDSLDGDPTIKDGDIVIDLHDGAWGKIDFVHNGMVAIRDGQFPWVVEAAIPLNRVVKLRKVITSSSEM